MKCLHVAVVVMIAAGLLYSECSADNCAWERYDFDDIYNLTRMYVETDKQLNQKYNELQGLLDDADKKTLKAIQLKWLRQRNMACGICKNQRLYIDVECAKEKTEAQLLFLKKKLAECRFSGCSLSGLPSTDRQNASVPTEIPIRKKKQVAMDSTFQPIPPPEAHIHDVKLYANEHVEVYKIPFTKRNSILNVTQCTLFSALTRTVKKEVAVLPWVNISDVIHSPPMDWAGPVNVFTSETWRSIQFDFLLCNAADMSPLCAIKIQQATSDKWVRKKGVLMNLACKAVDLPLVEIQAKMSYEPEELKRIFSEKVKNVVR